MNRANAYPMEPSSAADRWQRRLWAVVVTALVVLASWATYSLAQGAGEQPAEELETFVPTEKVAVDQAVAFPVDI